MKVPDKKHSVQDLQENSICMKIAKDRVGGGGQDYNFYYSRNKLPVMVMYGTVTSKTIVSHQKTVTPLRNQIRKTMQLSSTLAVGMLTTCWVSVSLAVCLDVYVTVALGHQHGEPEVRVNCMPCHVFREQIEGAGRLLKRRA